MYLPKTPYIGKINSKYRIQIVMKAKLDNNVMNKLYENLDKYDKIKSRYVNVSIIRNPV